MRRSAFIVMEGCDNAGRSTQMKMLVQALNKLKYPTEAHRNTLNGALINQYLTSKVDLSRETVHSLFSANRWDCRDDILKTLESGKTVVDRFAISGAAYSAVNAGKSLNWCKKEDKGLPAQDLVILLQIDGETQAQRSGWGKESFESRNFQRRVAENYLKLTDDTWKIVDNYEIEATHSKVFKAAIDTTEAVSYDPIKTLYESLSL